MSIRTIGAAALLAAGISALGAAQAAPVAPPAAAVQIDGQLQIEDVRWVRRCRWVQNWRYGPVQRCRDVWVEPRYRPYPRYPRPYPPYPYPYPYPYPF